MAKSRRELKVSEDGLINDIEGEIIRMCQVGFDDDPTLRYMRQPKVFDAVNPNEVVLTEVPALHAWCSGFGVERDSMGGLGNSGQGRRRGRDRKGPKVSRKFEFYCQIQYIIPEVETREASKELRKVAWWLFELIDGNLDLDGFVVGSPSLEEVELFPKWRLVGDEVKTVSNVNIKIVYPFVDMSAISRK
jgi:hypothetical protein